MLRMSQVGADVHALDIDVFARAKILDVHAVAVHVVVPFEQRSITLGRRQWHRIIWQRAHWVCESG